MNRTAIAALAAWCVALLESTSAADLPRVASMNLCTDQLLISLADPGQILGLSRYEGGRFKSFAVEGAEQFRVLSGGAEDVLLLHPDVVVASQYDKRSTRELLKEKGLHLAEFAVPRNLDEVRAQIREMGDLVGHPDRATAEVSRLDDAIARARKAVSQHHYKVLPLSQRGWVSGSDSLLSSLLAETGLFNAAGDLGIAFGGYASLEAIVNLQCMDVARRRAAQWAIGDQSDMHLRALGRGPNPFVMALDPLAEFHTEAVRRFGRLLDQVGERSAATFDDAVITSAGLDLAAADLKRPTATWTYVVQDNPFGTDADTVARRLKRLIHGASG